MTLAQSTLRRRMLMTTAIVGISCVLPQAAHAQLVNSGDLSSAVDSAGNPGQLTVTDTSATQTDIEVEAAVVVAEWTDFNVDAGDTLNVTIDAGLGLTEATLFNRVIGGSSSNIDGTINATDVNFWLVNQNGIMFGADATVNARSFFASTNDVANQDIFDFYEGTDLFGNGSNRLGFVDPSAGTTQAITAASGATFVTDGSLGFVGQGLNLNASFDAGSGRAFFLAASDIDVTFTPNSPLSYTVNAGTTVASQVIDGSVNAGSVEFAMFNSAGVVGALLQVDASVNATNVAIDGNRVSLVALGFGAAQPDVLVNGAIASDGDISITSGGAITTASLDADNGGGVILSSPGDITTTSITSNEPGLTNGFIDVESTGGGTLDLGALISDGDIDIDTSGSLTTVTITSLGDLTIGGVADPSSVTFNGNVDADAIDIDSTGLVSALGLEAGDGGLNISASAITAGAVSSIEGNVILAASGNITTASITSTEAFGSGGNIDVDSTGGSIAFAGGSADGDATFDAATTMAVDGSFAGTGDVALTSGGNVTFGTNGQISGAQVVVSTDAAFINNRGSDAITATDNWIVYSANPDDNVFGGLDSGNTAIWNSTIGTVQPSTIGDNRYVFAFQPTLVIGSSLAGDKTYGDDITADLATSGVAVSGLQAGVAGAYLGDTLASVTSGTPSITSAGAAASADVAGSPYAINVAAGTLVATNGYALTFDSSGQITVVPLALNGTALVDDRTYDGTTDATGTITLNGVIAGDDVGTSGTTFTFTDPNAGTDITVNVSGTTLTGGDAGNYTLTVPATALADILQRVLEVTTPDVSKRQGTDDPELPFEVTGEGLVAGDNLAGGPSRVTGEDPGDFAITVGTLDAGPNYIIDFTGGVFTITPAPDITPSAAETALLPATKQSAEVEFEFNAICPPEEERCEL